MHDDNKEDQEQPEYVPIWSISEGWRALFIAILILINIGGLALSTAIELEQRELFEAAFEDIISRTALIGVGSVPVTFAITELARTIKMLSTWVEKKLNENLRKSREKRIAKERQELEKQRQELEEELERQRQELEEELEKQRQEGHQEGRQEGRQEGYNAGREAERAIFAGKKPPPPPWERNGAEKQN